MQDLTIPILIADDSLAFRQLVKGTLHDLGYVNYELASNGAEALTKIQNRAFAENQKQFRIIFLDWNMPELDGLSIIRILRKDLNNENTAVIMMTATADGKSILQAMEEGATFYATKPLSAETIAKKLAQAERWLEQRQEGVKA